MDLDKEGATTLKAYDVITEIGYFNEFLDRKSKKKNRNETRLCACAILPPLLKVRDCACAEADFTPTFLL